MPSPPSVLSDMNGGVKANRNRESSPSFFLLPPPFHCQTPPHFHSDYSRKSSLTCALMMLWVDVWNRQKMTHSIDRCKCDFLLTTRPLRLRLGWCETKLFASQACLKDESLVSKMIPECRGLPCHLHVVRTFLNLRSKHVMCCCIAVEQMSHKKWGLNQLNSGLSEQHGCEFIHLPLVSHTMSLT